MRSVKKYRSIPASNENKTTRTSPYLPSPTPTAHMPLAHRSVLADKLKTPQPQNGIGYNPVASSFPAGPATDNILPGSTYGIDTGLNTLQLHQQMAQPHNRNNTTKRRRTPLASLGTSTFGVVGHQEDSHLDRLEKLGRKRPGPASYKVPPLHSIGGKFNLSNAKSDVDWLCYNAARQPGPATYTLPPHKVHGGKFSAAFPKSDVDWLIYYAARKPGVGEYDLDEAFHKYVGAGPEARMSAVDRGLYHEQSTYQPKPLPRKIARKSIMVTDQIHQSRKKRRSFARYAPGDQRRQTVDRSHTNKTLGKSLHSLRRQLTTSSASTTDLSMSTSSHFNVSSGGSSVTTTGLNKNTMESRGFKHASASELLAPPTWDATASVHHHESVKGRPDHFVVPKQRQGGAGACWASSSAGLVFVAHNEARYKLDKAAHKNHDVRCVVRVAPLRVPRF